MTITKTTETTTAQDQAIAAELVLFGKADATVSIYASAYQDEQPGSVSFTISHPGVKADGSDWSMVSDTLLADGSHWDTDPIKPWEAL